MVVTIMTVSWPSRLLKIINNNSQNKLLKVADHILLTRSSKDDSNHIALKEYFVTVNKFGGLGWVVQK